LDQRDYRACTHIDRGSVGSGPGLVLSGTAAQRYHAPRIFDVSDRRAPGAARRSFETPDAVHIAGYSRCDFICVSRSDFHHTGVARGWLLGVGRSPTDLESDTNVAILAYVGLDTGLAPTQCQSSLPDCFWWQGRGLLSCIQCKSKRR
jgi:hypothetical protein